jgi:transposase
MRVSNHRIYTPEFRLDAVELLRRSDRTLTQVARDLGVSVVTLRSWYKREEMAKAKKKGPSPRPKAVPGSPGAPEQTPEQRVARLEREVQRLQKENDALRMDREILKKAAAFFAKESE